MCIERVEEPHAIVLRNEGNSGPEYSKLHAEFRDDGVLLRVVGDDRQRGLRSVILKKESVRTLHAELEAWIDAQDDAEANDPTAPGAFARAVSSLLDRVRV